MVQGVDYLGSCSLSGWVSQLEWKISNNPVSTRILILLFRAEVKIELYTSCLIEFVCEVVGLVAATPLGRGADAPSSPCPAGPSGQSRNCCISGGLCFLSPLSSKEKRRCYSGRFLFSSAFLWALTHLSVLSSLIPLLTIQPSLLQPPWHPGRPRWETPQAGRGFLLMTQPPTVWQPLEGRMRGKRRGPVPVTKQYRFVRKERNLRWWSALCPVDYSIFLKIVQKPWAPPNQWDQYL